MYFSVWQFWAQVILIVSSHPGIFSKHEQKQVSHRKKGDTDTDRRENLRWKQVACNRGDFP